jgi:ferredoxin
VRGIEKWYVDLDKCIYRFGETSGCAICIEVCPWSAEGGGGSSRRRCSRRERRRDILARPEGLELT